MNTQDIPTRLFDIVHRQVRHARRRPFFRLGAKEMYHEEYLQRCNKLSHSLLHYGLRRGEAVAIIAENSPDWNVVDMAVMQAGGVLLPMCVGLTAEEYVECLRQAGVRLLFLGDANLKDRFRLILPQTGTIEHVVLMDNTKGETTLDEWIAVEAGDEEEHLVRRRNLVTTDDVCTLCYMGGGTYRQLKHKDILEDVLEQASNESNRRQAAAGNNALCTLYGRTKNYVCQLVGRTVNYPEPTPSV